MGKLIKNNLGNFLAVLLIFLMLISWIFSGWPQIWPLGELGVDTIRVPPEIKEAQAALETLRPQIDTDAPSNTINLEYAWDASGDTTQSDTNYGASAAPEVDFYNWASAGQSYDSLDLVIKYEAQAAGGGDMYNIQYSTDNTSGICDSSTWTDIVVATSASAADHTTATTSLSNTQDLTKLCVRLNISKYRSPDNAHIYIEDIRTVGDYTAGNSAPEITSVSLNSGSNIILNEGTWVSASTTISITDADYCTDLSSVTATLYRAPTSTPGTTCTPEDGDCYREEIACIATTTGDTCGASDTTVEYDCGFHIWYIANPTDSGAYAGQIWAVSATTTDTSAATDTATNTQELIEVISLNALDVTSSINYGIVVAGDNTGSINQSTIVTNTGNTAIDTQVDAEGTDMCKDDFPDCAGDKFVVTSQEFSLTSGFIWSTGTDLTDAVQELETNITKPTSTTTDQTDIIYWGIGIPNATVIGTYTGQTNINAKIDD